MIRWLESSWSGGWSHHDPVAGVTVIQWLESPWSGGWSHRDPLAGVTMIRWLESSWSGGWSHLNPVAIIFYWLSSRFLPHPASLVSSSVSLSSLNLQPQDLMPFSRDHLLNIKPSQWTLLDIDKWFIQTKHQNQVISSFPNFELYPTHSSHYRSLCPSQHSNLIFSWAPCFTPYSTTSSTTMHTCIFNIYVNTHTANHLSYPLYHKYGLSHYIFGRTPCFVITMTIIDTHTVYTRL